MSKERQFGMAVEWLEVHGLMEELVLSFFTAFMKDLCGEHEDDLREYCAKNNCTPDIVIQQALAQMLRKTS